MFQQLKKDAKKIIFREKIENFIYVYTIGIMQALYLSDFGRLSCRHRAYGGSGVNRMVRGFFFWGGVERLNAGEK